MIEIMKGTTKYLAPSTLGVGLVEGYNEIGLERSLSKPQLRREVCSSSYILDQLKLDLNPLQNRLRDRWFKSAKAQGLRVTC